MFEYITAKILLFEFTLGGQLEAWGRHITWTNRGGAKRTPPPPFPLDTCLGNWAILTSYYKVGRTPIGD